MKVDWFQRGRDAFTAGHPRFIKDARISGKDRAAWYAGWNHQSQKNTAGEIPQETRQALSNCISETLNLLRSQP
jgi:hypothetical protein